MEVETLSAVDFTAVTLCEEEKGGKCFRRKVQLPKFYGTP